MNTIPSGATGMVLAHGRSSLWVEVVAQSLSKEARTGGGVQMNTISSGATEMALVLGRSSQCKTHDDSHA